MESFFSSLRSNKQARNKPHPCMKQLESFPLVGVALAPLMEGPDSATAADSSYGAAGERRKDGWTHWMKVHIPRAPSSASRRSDLRLLLGVMGAPLAPVHVSTAKPLPCLTLKNAPIEISSAKYIIQQYVAATGGQRLQSRIKNTYAMGRVRMVASEFETAAVAKAGKSRGGSPASAAAAAAESGGFVLWQKSPGMWYVEVAVGGSKVCGGSDGEIVWRQTPWLGAHAAKGPLRPLRRALQGLDPLTTAYMFAGAQCIAETEINGEDCFVLKLSADQETLKSRSEGPAELIRHMLFGYFSQRTGLLIQIEDSQLTRIESDSCDEAVYWETNIVSCLDDYRPIEGVMIAHSGRSVVTLFRFGETAMSHTRTRMEEAWTIEEVAFNVHGLSSDCFIPPADIIKSDSLPETCELPRNERVRGATGLAGNRAKVAALDRIVVES